MSSEPLSSEPVSSGPLKAAVIQASSVLFDTDRTLQKFADLLSDAARAGAALAVFPEAFIGGYPKGIDFGVRVGSRNDAGRELFRLYADGALSLNDERFTRMAEIIASVGICATVGFIERRGGTLLCSAAMFEKDGRLAGLHRKLMPTAMERVIWGQGDGGDLPIPTLSIGTICTAICWENYMPLLRAHYYAGNPSFWCAPTVDDRDVWLPAMQMIAIEGRTFVLSACQHMRRRDVAMGAGYDAIQGNDPDTVLIRGGSVIVAPTGAILAGPVYGEDAILTADLDRGAIMRGKFDLDTAGHYARPDIFRLSVEGAPTS